MIRTIKNSENDNEKISQLFIPKTDLKDDFDFSNVVIKKPWGYEYQLYNDEKSSSWILFLEKNSMTSMHCHIYKKTSLIVLQGEVIFSTLNEGIILKEGDCIVLDKKVFHSTQNIGCDKAILLEVEIPSRKTDVLRLLDNYGRESKGYESSYDMLDNIKYPNFKIDEKDFVLKKFGNSRLSISFFEEGSKIDKINEDIWIILDGRIFEKNNKNYFYPGDVLSINDNSSIEFLYSSKVLRIKLCKKPKKLKAILFDFDGVLGNTMGDNYKAWKTSFLDYGIEINREDYFPMEGLQLKEIAKILSLKYGLNNIDPEEIVLKKEKYYKEDNNFSFYPEVEEIINLLKERGLKLAIVSAANYQRLSDTVPKDFLSKFDSVITGDKITRGKPHPEPYLKAMEELNENYETSMVIENAPIGVTSAKNANLYCLAISSTMKPIFLINADEIAFEFKDITNSEVLKEIFN